VRRTLLSRNQMVGLGVVVVGTLAYIFAFLGGFGGVFASSTYTVKANFDSVEYIVVNDPVRIDGVQVGTVDGTSAAPGNDSGTVTMSIQSKYHIYNDASANLVWRTILGGNDAIAIDPGTRVAGPLHGAIPVSRDSNQVELDQVLLPFHGGAGSGLQTLLNQLAPALSNHADLRNDLNIYRGVAHAADVGGAALRGEIQDTDLRNLVKNAGEAAQALSVGTNASTTQQFVESAANTLDDLGGNPANLKASIQTFTRVYLDGSHYVFEPYSHLVTRVSALVKTLRTPARQIAPALDQFDPTLANAHTLLRDATPLVHKLAPAVDSLASTAKIGVPVVNQLNPGLTALAKTTLPGLAAKYPEEGGKPAYDLIGPTFIGIGALTDFFNQDGEFANLTAGLEGGNVQQILPCTLNFSQAASPTDLLSCESLSSSLGTLLSGGTGLLSTLARKPGGAAIYGSLLKSAERDQADSNAIEQTLDKVAPNVAKLIFHQGAAK
jgi:ABC-type transporter Mla subunit MlaD